MRLVRRSSLALWLALSLVGAGANAKPARPDGQPAAAKTARATASPPLRIYNVNTRERVAIAVTDRKGGMGKESTRRLRRLLRCTRSQRTHAIAGRLVRHLYTAYLHFGAQPIEVVSAFRYHRVDGGRPNTPHHSGRAIDFRIPGVENLVLAKYLRASFHPAGVGWYPNSTFVHLDVRDRDAIWIDLAGPKHPPEYVANVRSFDDYHPGAAAAGSVATGVPPAAKEAGEEVQATKALAPAAPSPKAP